MSRRVFDQPVWRKWFPIAGIVWCCALPSSLGLAGVLTGEPWAIPVAVGAFLLLTPIVWDLISEFRFGAARVVLTEEGLEARTFAGRSLRLRWQQIVSLEKLNNRGTNWVRLVSSEGERLLIDGRMPGFSEIMGEIRSRSAFPQEGRASEGRRSG